MGKAVLLLAVISNFLWTGLAVANAQAKPSPKDLLIKLKNPEAVTQFKAMAQDGGATIETLGTSQWLRIQLVDQQLTNLNLEQIRKNPNVLAVQPNYRIHLRENYRVTNKEWLAKLKTIASGNSAFFEVKADNPEIPEKNAAVAGEDPLFSKQWGMQDAKVSEAWKAAGTTLEPIVVAVIDTGVDYTHEDLKNKIWRNPDEIPGNGIDDDNNGYIDDVIGWDFVSNDNKPFDLTLSPWEIIFMGGNPGHGTHCAGNVGASNNNSLGIGGVAPNAVIMPLRFLSEHGSGTTADAIKAIDYAVQNGAKVLSNSWGSEGEDPADGENNQALKDSIASAEEHGVLFVAAAGNGHDGVGYDNDKDPNPGVPASYKNENIISVAAVDSTGALGSFSNWGQTSVDIAAPGVKVFSTTSDGAYNDLVLDVQGMQVSWDGTSMATPHVAGAAALYWGVHPAATWQQVKAAILNGATPLDGLKDKMVSGGKLNVLEMLSK